MVIQYLTVEPSMFSSTALSADVSKRKSLRKAPDEAAVRD